MTELPKSYEFLVSEQKWKSHWDSIGVYQWVRDVPRNQTFIVDTPPPTVSGQLHMGHMFSYTQADFVVRYKRMQGMNIFYPMGFDDNGLPTERLVEKQKNVKASSMDREEFVTLCKEVVVAEEEKFRDLFKSIALSVDWGLEYQTVSERSRTISQMSFLDLVSKNQVYRSEEPMIWDPVDQTALSQADIEDKERESVMNDIVFTSESGEQLVIATTRPELLPACVSIFFHPDDPRYQRLSGKYAVSPLFDRRVPIMADDTVQMDKGTGLVMCCTFGDSTDVLWWKKHKLPLRIILDKKGIITPIDDLQDNVFMQQLVGLKVSAARNKVIELLKENSLLLKQTPITQTVKCAERSGAPLEILSTPQWFIKSLEHKNDLLKRSEALAWHPQSMKIRLDNWINNLAFDWCISRQRFFGVPFPVWYSKRAGEGGKALYATLDQLPVNPLKDLPTGYSRDEVEPDVDVMDTWATSSISPQLSSHGISKDYALDYSRHTQLFPADLRPQAHEIIRTWAFSTILKAHLHQDVLPWKHIMISGWCLAEDKTKMSKSKGNVVTPENLLTQYGADVVRYWAGNSKLGADTAYSEDLVKEGKKLVNKLWNASKFTSQHFDKLDNNAQITCTIDKWLISKLHQTVTKATQEFEDFEYANALDAICNFFWKDFCDNYLELVKTRSYNEDGSDIQGQQSAIKTLYVALNTILKLFAPFLPYITEELYQALYTQDASIHSKNLWPQAQDFALDQESLTQGICAISILDFVRKSKAENNLSIKAPIKALNFEASATLLHDVCNDLKNVTSAERITQSGVDGSLNPENVKVTVLYPISD